MRRHSQVFAAIEVTLPWHRKFCEVIGPKNAMEALGLYTAGLCFCQAHRTDGVILDSQLPALMPMTSRQKLRNSRLLLCSGLWEKIDGGVLVHDYLDWNNSRAQIENISEKRAVAGALGGRQRAKQIANQVVHPDTDTDTDTKISSSPLSVDGLSESVLGYWIEKADREPTATEARSLRRLEKRYGAAALNVAIGQACSQGHQADEFGFVTAILKASYPLAEGG